jgi:hypothetical protein
MPRPKNRSKIGLGYVMLTYGLGLYGGLVSGLIVSWATTAPSAAELWSVGIILVAIGILLFVIINKFLGNRA